MDEREACLIKLSILLIRPTKRVIRFLWRTTDGNYSNSFVAADIEMI